MKFMHALVCIGIVLLPACSQQSFEEKVVTGGGKKMTNGDLVALFAKPVVYDYQFVNVPAQRGTVSTEPGGSVTLKWVYFVTDNSNKGSDSGTWRIDKDSFCIKWKESNKGQESCSTWYRTKDLGYTTVRMTGEPGAYIEFKP
jgi:hypothetical protein